MKQQERFRYEEKNAYLFYRKLDSFSEYEQKILREEDRLSVEGEEWEGTL
jgi:hypothetical protein